MQRITFKVAGTALTRNWEGLTFLKNLIDEFLELIRKLILSKMKFQFQREYILLLMSLPVINIRLFSHFTGINRMWK